MKRKRMDYKPEVNRCLDEAAEALGEIITATERYIAARLEHDSMLRMYLHTAGATSIAPGPFKDYVLELLRRIAPLIDGIGPARYFEEVGEPNYPMDYHAELRELAQRLGAKDL